MYLEQFKGVQFFWNNFTEGKEFSTRNTNPCLMHFSQISQMAVSMGLMIKNAKQIKSISENENFCTQIMLQTLKILKLGS